MLRTTPPSPPELPTPLLPPQIIPPPRFPQLQPNHRVKTPPKDIPDKVAPESDMESKLPGSKSHLPSEINTTRKVAPRDIPSKKAMTPDEEIVREAREDPIPSVARAPSKTTRSVLVEEEDPTRAPVTTLFIMAKEYDWSDELPAGIVPEGCLGEGGFGQVFRVRYRRETVCFFFLCVFLAKFLV